MLYGLNDITIIPAVITDVSSRSECDPYVSGSRGKELPLFTAPMSCVISDKNWKTFANNGVNTIIPRNIDFGVRIMLSDKTFVAMSLDEFENYFIKNPDLGGVIGKYYICVDLANGHMRRLINLCKKAKTLHGNKLVLMTGNIANPDTYLEYAKVGIDYIRLNIGSGNVCTTAANTGCFYPPASLLMGCVKHKKQIESATGTSGGIGWAYRSIPKIIADGGFKNFDQINKALALGADYCMIGEIFGRCEEACGKIYEVEKVINSRYISPTKTETTVEMKRVRDYYGMSTKRAQMEMGVTDPEKLKTAEGIVKQVTIDYTLPQWVDNFKHYLRSAMSYCNSRTLEEFAKSQTDLMSPQSYNCYFK